MSHLREIVCGYVKCLRGWRAFVKTYININVNKELVTEYLWSVKQNPVYQSELDICVYLDC